MQKYENRLLNSLQSMLDEYHKYLNEQDMEGVIGMIHSSSPAQTLTRQLLLPMPGQSLMKAMSTASTVMFYRRQKSYKFRQILPDRSI